MYYYIYFTLNCIKIFQQNKIKYKGKDKNKSD